MNVSKLISSAKKGFREVQRSVQEAQTASAESKFAKLTIERQELEKRAELAKAIQSERSRIESAKAQIRSESSIGRVSKAFAQGVKIMQDRKASVQTLNKKSKKSKKRRVQRQATPEIVKINPITGKPQSNPFKF